MNTPQSHHESLELSDQLEEFFANSLYVKKWPQYDQLLQKNWYLSYIMFTGSSGAWKTTSVADIDSMPQSLNTSRNYSMFGGDSIYYTIASRYITRKWRQSDNNKGFVENIYVEDEQKFMELVKKWAIEIWRKRDLWSEQVLYGFESDWKISGEVAKKRRLAKSIIGTDGPNWVRWPKQWGIIVYSGNNDMARNFEDIPFCVKHTDEFVHIHVQAENNTERFIERSKDVALQDKKQLEKRASDGGLDVYEKSHIVVTNASWQQDTIQREIENLMYILADYNKNVYQYKPTYTQSEIVEAINPWFSRKT